MQSKQVKYDTNPEKIVMGNISTHPVFRASNGRTSMTPPIIPLTRPITVMRLLMAIIILGQRKRGFYISSKSDLIRQLYKMKCQKPKAHLNRIITKRNIIHELAKSKNLTQNSI